MFKRMAEVIDSILYKVHCHEGVAGSDAYLTKAGTQELKEIFNKYATVIQNGEKFIDGSDFVQKFLGLFEDVGSDDKSLKIFSRIADTTKDGLISFAEFQAFEGLLWDPDAAFRIVFRLFDQNGNGIIGFDDFKNVIKQTEMYQKMPFDLDNSPLMKLYFGNDKKRTINYAEFDQFLRDFREECGTEAFRKLDNSGTGSITAIDFESLMVSINNHLVTEEVKNNLIAAVNGSQPLENVSFPYFVAFTSLLNNLEVMKCIYLNATAGQKTQAITKDEFLSAAQMMSPVTVLEVDILFHLCNLIHPREGKIVFNDLQIISPDQHFRHVHNRKLPEIQTSSSPNNRSDFVVKILENAYKFCLASVSGGIGAVASYPIDLVKTRMQNQRSGLHTGKLMYRNSFDCFQKVIKYEGFFGLYRGLLPQIIGTAPEKAIKLTVNDFVRGKISSNNKVPLLGEVFAGGCAGFCQVIITNPLEIVKVRMQVAGEVAHGAKSKALSVLKELGLFGLYKGASACFLRVTMNSAIYFPTYHRLKSKFADDTGYNSPVSLLASGCIASVPSTALATPADVIKTRLQVIAREGQTVYHGFWDCAVKIYKEEGARAFWKGIAARVTRSAPQYGVTLFSYELLQRTFPVNFQSPQQSKGYVNLDGLKTGNTDHIGGYRFAIPIIDCVESKFGLMFPKFKRRRPEKQDSRQT